jgi:hypothetical protein
MTRAGIIAWPPDRMYWAVLDAPSVKRGPRARRRELEYALEGEIPLLLDAVHVVFIPLDDGRVLACAAARDELEAIDDAISLTPSELPDWVDAAVEPASIELLSGSLTPRRITRLRRSWAAAFVACVLIALGLLMVGLELRIRAVASERQDVQADFETMLTEAGFDGPTAEARMQLLGRLRTMEQASPNRSPRPTSESMVVVARVLEAWPSDETIELGSIDASGEGVVINAAAVDATGAGDLASAMERALVEDGWRAQPPDVVRQRSGVDITLRYARPESGS